MDTFASVTQTLIDANRVPVEQRGALWLACVESLEAKRDMLADIEALSK